MAKPKMDEKHRHSNNHLKPVALVIGASGGIGTALSKKLVLEGYITAMVSPEEGALKQTCSEINSEQLLPCAFFYTHDVTNYSEIPTLFKTIICQFKRLDVVVYVTGIMPPVKRSGDDFENDLLIFKVNLLGAIAWLSLAATYFNNKRAGTIVGISSTAGDRGRSQNPSYSSSKAALNTYLESLRNRLTRNGVTVITIKPGFVDTRMIQSNKHKLWVISPKQAAADIYHAIQTKKQVSYTPARWALVMWVIRNIPSFIFRRLTI